MMLENKKEKILTQLDNKTKNVYQLECEVCKKKRNGL